MSSRAGSTARGRLPVFQCVAVLCVAIGTCASCYARPNTPVPSAALALAIIPVRFAVHPDFDRLVLTLPPGSRFVSRQDGSTVTVGVPGAGTMAIQHIAGRRLIAVAGDIGQVRLTLAPGSRCRFWKLGDRLVIDVLDATVRSAAIKAVPQPSETPTPPAVKLVSQEAALAARGLAQSATPLRPLLPDRLGNEPPLHQPISITGTPPPGNPEPTTKFLLPSPPRIANATKTSVPSAQQPPWQAKSLPQQLPNTATAVAGVAVTVLPHDGSTTDQAILVPFGSLAGAAAFTRGGETEIVFDVPQPLDLSALKDDPVFGTVTEHLLPGGMHLRLRLPATAQLRLDHRADGWVVAIAQQSAPSSLAPIAAQFRAGTLSLGADAAGHVVVVEDDISGGRLLVGTQVTGGQRVVSTHKAAEFSLLPTWQGVVVEPVSDRLSFITTAAGFNLSSVGVPKLSAVWPDRPLGTWPEGRAMTRLFDFPSVSAPVLQRRLGQAMRDAAVLPKLARTEPRLRVAQSMLAEGMDVEAAAVLQVAFADDPKQEKDPKAAGLVAIAHWLSAQAGGAPAPATNFDLAELGGSDEAALWRALLQPDISQSAKQAAALATTWPLILDYPPNLKRLILRPAAALLAAGGQTKALAAFLAACPDPSLDFSRAGQLDSQGKTDESLVLLDRVAARPDRLARAEALSQAVETRLAAHQIGARTAAIALAGQIYAWRGGERELQIRQRAAALRAQSGSWRDALALLRETDTLFPQAHHDIHAAETGIVADLMHPDRAGQLSALELVDLSEEASTLLTGADSEANLGPVLADKLLALDLPDRAEPILHRLFDRASENGAKAEIGLRLAGLLADRGELAAGLAVLDVADGTALGEHLTENRTLLRARLLAASGKATDALAALSNQTGRIAIDLRATILEGRHDWTGAAAVLAASRESSGFATLPDAVQRQRILREARDDSDAGDTAAMRNLRSAGQKTFLSGQGADLFAVLTAEPIQSVADLSRSAREVAGMQALPASLANNGQN